MAPKGGAQTQKKWAPKVGGSKFRAFFHLPLPFSPFFLSPLVFSRGILEVFGSARRLKCSRLEFSGCRVKPRRPEAVGVAREPKRARCHLYLLDMSVEFL